MPDLDILLPQSVAHSDSMAWLDAPLPRRVHSRELTVTPPLAAQWLIAHRYPHQRPLSEGHVAGLARAMARKEFKLGTIEFVRYPGGVYLVDGQHRLEAIVQSGMEQPMILLTHEVDTEEEAHVIYSYIDIGRPRRKREAPCWTLLCQDMGLTVQETRALFPVTGLIAMGFTRITPRRGATEMTTEERIRTAERFRQPIKTYFETTRQASRSMRRHLGASGVIGVSLVILEAQAERATRFVERLALSQAEKQHDGVWWALQFFMDRSSSRYEAAEVARGFALCWNTYFEEGTRNSLRGIKNDTPIHIEGTSYHRNRVRYLLPHLAPAEKEG